MTDAGVPGALFVRFAWLGARRHASYRAATAAGAFTNSVFGLVRAYVLLDVWQQRPDLGGYSAAAATTFVFLGQALIATMALFAHGLELPSRIRSGAVVVDLYRPTGFLTYWLACDVGRAAVQLVTRGVPPLLAGALVFGLSLPTDAPTWVAFVTALVLGFAVSFGLRYVIAVAGFWLLDDKGLQTTYVLLTMFFSGMLVPLAVFPDGLRETAYALPFCAMVQVPADVLVGAATGADVLVALASQAGWAAALLGAGALLTRTATRKLVIQGG